MRPLIHSLPAMRALNNRAAYFVPSQASPKSLPPSCSASWLAKNSNPLANSPPTLASHPRNAVRASPLMVKPCSAKSAMLSYVKPFIYRPPLLGVGANPCDLGSLCSKPENSMLLPSVAPLCANSFTSPLAFLLTINHSTPCSSSFLKPLDFQDRISGTKALRADSPHRRFAHSPFRRFASLRDKSLDRRQECRNVFLRFELADTSDSAGGLDRGWFNSSKGLQGFIWKDYVMRHAALFLS